MSEALAYLHLLSVNCSGMFLGCFYTAIEGSTVCICAGKKWQIQKIQELCNNIMEHLKQFVSSKLCLRMMFHFFKLLLSALHLAPQPEDHRASSYKVWREGNTTSPVNYFSSSTNSAVYSGVLGIPQALFTCVGNCVSSGNLAGTSRSTLWLTCSVVLSDLLSFLGLPFLLHKMGKIMFPTLICFLWLLT